MKKTLVALLAGGLLAAAAAAPGLAAPNPAGTGQPGAECGEAGATMEPAGSSLAALHMRRPFTQAVTAPPSLAHGTPCGFPIRHRLLPGDVEPLEVCSRPGCVLGGAAGPPFL